MDQITLYAYHFRSRAERVLWTLQELGFSFELKRLNPMQGDTRTPEFLAMNPQAKVPVLTMGDQVFTESLAIMDHLNSLHPDQPLLPRDPQCLYQCRQMIAFGMSEIEPYLWLAEQNTRLSMFYHWPEGTAAEASKRATAALPTVFGWLTDRTYIAGESFSLADIYAYQLITWGMTQDVATPQHVGAYLQRLSDRPAFPDKMGRYVAA
jgi:glutathione S-transferase